MMFEVIILTADERHDVRVGEVGGGDADERRVRTRTLKPRPCGGQPDERMSEIVQRSFGA
jgi:hypothetical protein